MGLSMIKKIKPIIILILGLILVSCNNQRVSLIEQINNTVIYEELMFGENTFTLQPATCDGYIIYSYPYHINTDEVRNILKKNLSKRDYEHLTSSRYSLSIIEKHTGIEVCDEEIVNVTTKLKFAPYGENYFIIPFKKGDNQLSVIKKDGLLKITFNENNT